MLVGLSGFEPLTSRLSGVRSDQLSYRPVIHLQARDGSALAGVREVNRTDQERPGNPGWLSESWIAGG